MSDYGLTPDEVEVLADQHYGSYKTRSGKLFALLVDVAWTYELELRRQAPDPTADQADPETGSVPLAVAAGMTPRDVLLAGLAENLEQIERRH